MRTLLQFLAKYSVLLLFLVLETVAFILLVHHNNYPQSAILSSANTVSATIYQLNNSVIDYFSLKKQNMIIMEENAELREKVTALENRLELYSEDTILSYVFADKNLEYTAAKVINSSINLQKNYLTLNKGSRDGVGQDMAVISKNGVVGIVRETSDKFSVVIPIINPLLSISCKLKKSGYTGMINWAGNDYRFAQLTDIARHIDVAEGDTIVTSGLSEIFPSDMLVGVVENAELSESDAYYRINVRLAVDFANLKYVTIIENKNKTEQVRLETIAEK